VEKAWQTQIAGKPDERLTARDGMVSVNDVGCLGELSQVVDHANAAGGYLLGRRPERGRIDDGPVASAQQTEREVAGDGLRSGAMGQPHIRDQNDQSVHHPRRLISVADLRCCMGKLSPGATRCGGIVHRGKNSPARRSTPNIGCA